MWAYVLFAFRNGTSDYVLQSRSHNRLGKAIIVQFIFHARHIPNQHCSRRIMIWLMLSAFQLIMSAQLNISQIMSPSENFLKDALRHCRLQTQQTWVLFLLSPVSAIWWGEEGHPRLPQAYTSKLPFYISKCLLQGWY